ncbi:MAG: hypothetical protein ACRDOM_03295, partial [Nocardioides sp.]
MFGRKTDHEHTETDTRDVAETRAVNRDAAHQRYGGINWGAAFFGWLVAIAMVVLLAGIVTAVAAAVDQEIQLTQSEVEAQGETAGLVAAIVVIAIFALAYYLGGYVAGRMSRFDGGRQGLGVWIFGLLVTIIAVVLGVVFGDQYNVLDEVNPPNLDTPEDAGIGAIIAGIVLL